MTSIRVATVDDQERVAGLLARAFDDDPFINFLVKQDGRRRERIQLWADIVAEGSIASGETYVTDDLTGAAIWTPPEDDSEEPPSRFARWNRLRHRLGPIGALRVGRALDVLEAYQPPAKPYVYFRIVGVEPDRQGTGIGTQLITHGLERWASEDLPVYLHSTKARNVALYERHGFQVIEQLDLPGGPSLWPMWRDAS